MTVVEGSAAARTKQTDLLAIDARELRYLYARERGLKSLDLQVPAGTTFGLLGRNGSGKSTFLLLIAGLLNPQAGLLKVLGHEGRAIPRRRMGWVFQEQSLDPLLSVRETLELSTRLYGGATRDPMALAASFGLNDRLNDRAGELSGGLRRRLELARAVQHRPDLLLLDEPTLGLDIDSRKAFWEELGRLNASGLTVLAATNDVSEAEQYCSEVAFIRDGRAVAQGSPAHLRAGLRPESLQLRWPGLSDTHFAELGALDGVVGATRSGEMVRLTAPDARAVIPGLLALQSGKLEAIEVGQSSLEDAYFQITGSLLRASPGDGA